MSSIKSAASFESAGAELFIVSGVFGIFVVIVLLFIFAISQFVQAAQDHQNPEKYYQNVIAKQLGGQTEFLLDDNTRIDILTDDEAIEVEFAHKWYESIGQSAYYAFKTGKNPVIWLIRESNEDDKYIERCRKLCDNGVAIKQKGKWIQIKVNVYESSGSKTKN